MQRNLGTRLPRRSRDGTPMAAFDALPPPLRRWLAGAQLNWSASSALKLWRRALTEGGDTGAALARCAAAERRLVARDAGRVWGQAHPAAGGDSRTGM
jgi:hypothetical protein